MGSFHERFGFSVGPRPGMSNGMVTKMPSVGAPAYANGQSEEGAVFFYHGSASGLNTDPDWIGSV
jgi:hypothetical protein